MPTIFAGRQVERASSPRQDVFTPHPAGVRCEAATTGTLSRVIPHVDEPRGPDGSGPRPDPTRAVDVAVGVLGASVAVGMTLVRAASRTPPLRVAWRPPLLPTRLQPASFVQELGRRGEQHRQAALRLLGHVLDEVMSTVDFDRIIERVDAATLVEGILAEIDLPAIVRESTGSLTSDAVQTARMTGISADEAISRGLDRFLRRLHEARADGAP